MTPEEWTHLTLDNAGVHWRALWAVVAEHFASAIRAEREACAKVAESLPSTGPAMTRAGVARAIRARGEP
jgi:hypothetical protein